MPPSVVDVINDFCDQSIEHDGLSTTPARRAELLAERIARTGTGMDYARIVAHALISACG